MKNKILPVICDFFGDFDYQATVPTEKQNLRPYTKTILPGYTRSHFEDYIHGHYKNLDFEMNELELKQKQNKSTVTVFKGLLIRVEFPKAFHGRTILKKDAGRFGNWFNSFGKDERVELEDPKFESMFEVYGTDQVEARFLLTTAFMERLIALKENAGAQGISCQFENNEMLIALRQKKNLFEPTSIHKSVLKQEDIHTFLKQMNDIFQVMDTLKLDRI